jgi:hypothetical protein
MGWISGRETNRADVFKSNPAVLSAASPNELATRNTNKGLNQVDTRDGGTFKFLLLDLLRLTQEFSPEE